MKSIGCGQLKWKTVKIVTVQDIFRVMHVKVVSWRFPVLNVTEMDGSLNLDPIKHPHAQTAKAMAILTPRIVPSAMEKRSSVVLSVRAQEKSLIRSSPTGYLINCF